MKAALDALQLRAWSCALTIRIARIVNDEEVSWNTATGVLMEFRGRAVIATAWHVLEAFRRIRNTGQEVALVCDNMVIRDPSTAYRDEESDVALLDVPVVGRQGIGAVPYRPGSLWPPPQVRVADTIFVCGFPRLLRVDGSEILHGDVNVLVDVASAAEKHFMLQVEWEQLEQVGRVVIPTHTDFGGVSGGPAFLWDAGGNPLVGVVSEAGENLPLWRITSLAHLPAGIDQLISEPL
jgi:hypothetical protein